MKVKYHRIPVSRNMNLDHTDRTIGRTMLDTMMSIGWSFYGIEWNKDKKVNEYLFKENINNEKR